VAPLGTALTPHHAKLVRRYCDSAVLVFDPDSAGLAASLRGAFVLMQEGVFVRIAQLGGELDPDEFLRKHGRQEFERVVENAVDIAEFHTGIVLRQFKGPLGPQDKARAAATLLETISAQPDPIIRTEWVRRLSERLGIEEADLRSRISAGSAAVTRRTAFSRTSKPEAEEMPNLEADLVKWLLRSPSSLPLCSLLEEKHFRSKTCWRLFSFMRRAQDEGLEEAKWPAALADSFPEYREFVMRLAVEEPPKYFDPQRDVADAAKQVRRVFLEGRFKELNGIIKKLQAEGRQAPPEMMNEQMLLGRFLKSGGSHKEAL
jgi:DNA primase